MCRNNTKSSSNKIVLNLRLVLLLRSDRPSPKKANMYSDDDEDMEFDTPEEVNKASASNTAALGVPAISKSKYEKVYEDFQKWNKLKGATPVTENVLIKYFTDLAVKSKPSTLWVYHSMLKSTLRSNDNLDISSYATLIDLLKKKNAGYKPFKSPTFTEQEIEKFLNEAPDDRWLDVKVVCVFGINGVHTSNKFVNVMVEHIKHYEDLILVTIPKTETSPKRSFTITGSYFNIVKKYADLRPPKVNINRFFLHYNDDKCTMQPIGRNKFFEMPRRIAKYLKLPQPERYSSNSFRLSAASISANTNVWNPTSVGEESIEYSLDYETGLMKSSSVSYSVPSVSAVSNMNHSKNGNPTCNTTSNTTARLAGNTTGDTTGEHECTISCGKVQCAMEENERTALHAFTILKPSDYAIIEVTAATFASEPICRWIVAYTHITEPVSSFNADETFEDITRTTPLNVRVVQKYIRSNSSQLLAAYVVVYGVNCRCHKESSDIFSFSVNEIKYET